MKRALATAGAVLTLGAGFLAAGCGNSTNDAIDKAVNDPDTVAKFCAGVAEDGQTVEELYGYMVLFPGIVASTEKAEGMEPGTVMRFMEELIGNGGCPKVSIDDAPATYDPATGEVTP